MMERFHPVLSALPLSLGVSHWMAREFADSRASEQLASWRSAILRTPH